MESSVHPSVDFFLGATTPAGFKGYFAPLRREPGMQLVLLKSGPGCGKSTLMKRLARAAQDKGEPIQRIHCASDPDSLDGVVFLRQKRAIIDATAPHVVEPEAPGADERVLSLYHTIDADALHPHKDEVTALFARNQLLRSRAARYVASAGSLLLDSRRAEACSANFEKVRRYVKRLCTRLLPRTEEMGSEELRLLSAITPKGEVFYQGTVQALADKCILFRDDYGAVSRLLLELIRAETLARDIPVEDTAAAVLNMKHGGICVIQGCTTAYPGFSSTFYIHGEKGTVVFNDEGILEWKFLDEADAPQRPDMGERVGGAGAGLKIFRAVCRRAGWGFALEAGSGGGAEAAVTLPMEPDTAASGDTTALPAAGEALPPRLRCHLQRELHLLAGNA